MTSRPSNRPSRIGELVEAAIRVFGRRGYADVTMEQVAEESGLVPSALYYHFAGKEQLFEAAVAQVREEIAQITGRGGPPLGTMAEVIRSFYVWALEHPERADLLWIYSAGATGGTAGIRDGFIAEHARDLGRYFGAADEMDPDELGTRVAVVTGNTVALSWIAGDLFDGEDTDRIADACARVMSRLARA